MIKVGITGGIGSGKSTVAKVFENSGYPVYYADDRAKTIMNENLTIKGQITSILGKEAYYNGSLNRKYVAQKIFSNKTLLNQINSIVHPEVKKDFDHWCSTQNSKIVFKEAALLFENGTHKSLDKNIVVFANEQTRVNRVIARDRHRNEEDVLKIIRKQIQTNKALQMADYSINNDDNVDVLAQIEKIEKDILV